MPTRWQSDRAAIGSVQHSISIPLKQRASNVTDNIIPFNPQRQRQHRIARIANGENFLQSLNDLIVHSLERGTPPQLIVRYMRDGARAVNQWLREHHE
jgi:hypothetical protein